MGLIDAVNGKMPEETKVAEPVVAAPVVEENKSPENTENKPIVEQAAPIVAPVSEENKEGSKPSHDWSWTEGIFDIEEKTTETIKAAIEKERRERDEEIEILKNAPKKTFANEEVRKYNAFVEATGNSDFSVFKKLTNISISKDSTPQQLADIIVAKQILDNPDKASIENALVSKLLKSLPEIDEHSTDDERQDYAIALSDLNDRAKDSMKSIGEVLDKIKDSEPKEIDLEGAKLHKRENLSKWEGIANKGLDQLKFSIPKVEVKDGVAKELGDSMLDVNFDANQKDIYKSNFLAYIEYVGSPEPSEKELENAHNYSYERVLLQNIPALMADAYAKGKSEEAKSNAKEELNPSAAARTEVKTDVSSNVGAGNLLKAIG